MRRALGDSAAPAPSRSRADPATPSACRTASATDRPDGRWRSRGSARAGVVVEPLAAGFHDAFAGRQQRLGRGIAERHQHVRIDQFDLALDERQADLRLLRRRRAVAGRPPRNDVGDIGVAAVEPDRGDHPVQQFAGTSDERQPLDVLVASGRLADEHDARLRVAVGEHQPRRGAISARSRRNSPAARAAPPATARCAPLPAPMRSRPPAPARFRCAKRAGDRGGALS